MRCSTCGTDFQGASCPSCGRLASGYDEAPPEPIMATGSAEFAPPLPATVTEVAFGPESDDSWWYAVVIDNPNPDYVFDTYFDVHLIGADGATIETSPEFAALLPGRTVLVGTVYDIGDNEIADIQVDLPEASEATLLPGAEVGSFTIDDVVAESDGARPESRVFLAAPLTANDLEHDFAGRIREVDLVEWHEETGMVARRQRRLDAIVLGERSVRDPDPSAVAAALATEVRRRGLEMLPWSESARRLRMRLRFLHHHDASWPDVSDASLLDTLVPPLLDQLGGVRSASDLRRIDVNAGLLAV